MKPIKKDKMLFSIKPKNNKKKRIKMNMNKIIKIAPRATVVAFDPHSL